ncbi:hypothetical protein Ciccas_003075 [Cichlidogyrus casuarinus]|uniref:C2H2-type domain-containing protein n=1 Tax=Cichlidogyrus casuarinus TaxID=1844966 RepID=A0ABD2QG26_9PLAT
MWMNLVRIYQLTSDPKLGRNHINNFLQNWLVSTVNNSQTLKSETEPQNDESAPADSKPCSNFSDQSLATSGNCTSRSAGIFPRYPDVSTSSKSFKPVKAKNVYVCSHCGRGFTKAYNRTIHERTHTDERPFSCEVCHRRFRRKDHLRDHSYTHLSKKPFTCDICQRGFCQARSLDNHKRVNHKT